MIRQVPVLIWVMLIFSCSSGKKASVTPGPGPVPKTVMKTYPTEIILHYKLHKQGITDTVNRALSDALKGPFDFSSYGVEVSLTKAGNANVELQGKTVLIIVPVSVQIVKKTFLTDLRAKGLMEMSFVSDVDIDTLWRVKTKTQLRDYRWKETPVLSVAGFSIPIETLSDAVVNRSKANIEKEIDASVRESFPLRTKMLETIKLFSEPFRIDTPMQAALQIKPYRFFLNKINNSRHYATGKIGLLATAAFTTDAARLRPTSLLLPGVYWSEKMSDTSTFRLLADIRSDQVTNSLQSSLVGKTFTSDGRSITIQRASIRFATEGLTVSVNTKGSFNGTIEVLGVPVYDPSGNALKIEIRDIRVKTKNILHKAAAWLGEGKIRSDLEKQLHFPLSTLIQQAQEQCNRQLQEMNAKYDFDITVGLGKAFVEAFEMTDGQLLALVQCRFYLSVGIRDFRSFSKF